MKMQKLAMHQICSFYLANKSINQSIKQNFLEWPNFLSNLSYHKVH